MNLSSLKPQRCIHRWSNLSVIGSLGILHTPTSRLPEQTQSGTQLHSSHWEKMDSESHTDSSCFPLGRNMQRFCSHLLASKSHGPTFYQDHKKHNPTILKYWREEYLKYLVEWADGMQQRYVSRTTSMRVGTRLSIYDTYYAFCI